MNGRFRFAGSDQSAPPSYTVSQITRKVKDLVEEAFLDVWVSGEIVGLKRHGSGHIYLTLKDTSARLNAVIFRGQVPFLVIPPGDLVDGAQVVCHGRLDLYEPHGAYKLIIDQVRIEGLGRLLQDLEELKRRLHEEGLFDAARKKPLPFLPRVIGVVTSGTSAAFQDMLKIIDGRFPTPVKLYPATVQGGEAAADMIRGLGLLDRDPEVDVILLGRGGGAFEDLLPFSDEALVRAVAACRTPVISAVGHQIDTPLSDYAADRRAATPTDAATMVVPDGAEIHQGLNQARRRLDFAMTRLTDQQQMALADTAGRLDESAGRCLTAWSNRMETLSASLRSVHPATLLDARADRVKTAWSSLRFAMDQHTRTLATRLESTGRLLEQLGPGRVLQRGFSIVRRSDDGRVISGAEQADLGLEMEILLSRGRLQAIVSDKEEPTGSGSGALGQADQKSQSARNGRRKS